MKTALEMLDQIILEQRDHQRFRVKAERETNSKMTNGLLEGINGMVQAAKRRARGYRNVENLIAMVYMTANKLHMPVLGARRAH